MITTIINNSSISPSELVTAPHWCWWLMSDWGRRRGLFSNNTTFGIISMVCAIAHNDYHPSVDSHRTVTLNPPRCLSCVWSTSIIIELINIYWAAQSNREGTIMTPCVCRGDWCATRNGFGRKKHRASQASKQRCVCLKRNSANYILVIWLTDNYDMQFGQQILTICLCLWIEWRSPRQSIY